MNKKYTESFPAVPESFHARVGETLAALDTAAPAQASKKSLSKPVKVLLVAAVITAALSVSVAAGGKGWLTSVGSYGWRLFGGDPGTTTAAEPVIVVPKETAWGEMPDDDGVGAYVKLVWDYTPENLIPTEDYEKFHMLNADGEEVHAMTIRLHTLASAETLEFKNVVKTEEYTFGAHQGAIMTQQNGDETARELLIWFDDMGYVLQAYVEDIVSDAELVKIANGLRLEETDRAHAFMPEGAYLRGADADNAAVIQPIDDPYWSVRDALVKTVAAGTAATIRGLEARESTVVGEGSTVVGKTKFSVTLQNARFADTVDGIDRTGIHNMFLKEIAEDGTIKPAVRNIWAGDGVNDLHRIIATETTGRRLLLVTYTVKNESGFDAHFSASSHVAATKTPDSSYLFGDWIGGGDLFYIEGQNGDDGDYYFVPVKKDGEKTLTVGYLVDDGVDSASLIAAWTELSADETQIGENGAARTSEIHFDIGAFFR